MTTEDSTLSFSDPPKQPLFLSNDVLRACYDIDKNGFELANLASLKKFSFLAICLMTEALNFIQAYPHSKPAGLLLNVEVLLLVWEPLDEPKNLED